MWWVQTYDVEFNIGRPESSRVLALKEEVIQQLRLDLDRCREQLNSTLQTTIAAVEEEVVESNQRMCAI